VPIGQTLEQTCGVVVQVADRPPGEARQAGDLCGLRAEPGSEGVEESVLQLPLAGGVTDEDASVPHLEGGLGVAAEEGVAGEALAP
jgi:hypothetical protein